MIVTMRNAIFLVFIYLLLACTPNIDPAITPALPEHLPADAKWVGGIDGGVFINFGGCPTLDNCLLTTYNKNGLEIYQGKMQASANAENKNARPPAQHEWTGWDGDNLYSKTTLTATIAAINK